MAAASLTVLFALSHDATLGPRPEWLVHDMEASPLKSELEKCLEDNFSPVPHPFSIGHRGACLQLPEHTLESYRAAIEMGAGIVECDVAVTSDGELVCRHSECDLHTTTDILITPLASKCTEAFTPADAEAGTSASARCCTSDITLEEFKTLCGKMDASDSTATTPEEFLGGTAGWRTDLYSLPTCSTLVSHKESIELIKAAGRKFTPELKTYHGLSPLSYDQVRQKMVDEYVEASVPPSDVWPQSFNEPDVVYWVENTEYGAQAVYLDDDYTDGMSGGKIPLLLEIKSKGINIMAPPMQMLVQVKDEEVGYEPSNYSLAAKDVGLQLITWTLERSGPLASGGGWYYGTTNDFTNNDGDMLELLHVLAKDVGVEGVFSDWPATTTFYANCILDQPPESAQEVSQVGPRPQWLVHDMESSPLKTQLERCIGSAEFQNTVRDFSIAHRGACLQLPEHTLESYRAAIEMGAGIVECDVAVTSDGELVCRHSECDLHTTTNILITPLASKCTEAFTPADAEAGTSASARCCTSDITLEEFKTLCGKMDASDSTATTPEEFLGGTAGWRTDLYAENCPTLVSHKESIELIKAAGRKFTPELKDYSGSSPLSYDQVRQKMINEYVEASVPPSDVWPQSFNEPDVVYWVENTEYGAQAVYLDNEYTDGMSGGKIPLLPEIKSKGINIMAPPMQMLVQVKDEEVGYEPSNYSLAAKDAGLQLITWTLERSGPLASGGGWYYGTTNDYTNNDGDMLELLHVLAKDVGVEGVFSDWPATTTFYASCIWSDWMPCNQENDGMPCSYAVGGTCTCSSSRRELLFSSAPKPECSCQ